MQENIVQKFVQCVTLLCEGKEPQAQDIQVVANHNTSNLINLYENVEKAYRETGIEGARNTVHQIRQNGFKILPDYFPGCHPEL